MTLKTPDMLPPKLLERVHESLKREDGETVVVMFDRTTLGSLKAGLAITDRRVVEYDKERITQIRLDDVASVTISTSFGTLIREVALDGRSGARLVSSVYLSDEGLEQLVAPIRARVARRPSPGASTAGRRASCCRRHRRSRDVRFARTWVSCRARR